MLSLLCHLWSVDLQANIYKQLHRHASPSLRVKEISYTQQQNKAFEILLMTHYILNILPYLAAR